MKCETFVYSHERFITGIENIDKIQRINAYSMDVYLSSGTGDYQIGEVASNGSSVSAKVAEWDALNKVVRLHDITGTLSNTEPIIGVTSEANWSIDVFNTYHLPTSIEADNEEFENEAHDKEVVNFDESNPFGEF